MTVRELINILYQCDPDVPVRFSSSEVYDPLDDAVEITTVAEVKTHIGDTEAMVMLRDN